MKAVTNEMPAIFEDLADVRKESFIRMKNLKDSGTNVVGTFCTYTPKEILYAGNIVTVNLCGVSEEPIPAAEKDLPANLCPLIKSSYGHAITDTCPFFYFSDMILGETTCDGKKKMFEILNSEVKETFIMMLPQTYKFESGIPLYISEMERLIERIEEKFNIKITEDDLRRAIHQSNEDRKNFSSLLEMSKLVPAPFKGMDMVNILEAYDFTFSSEEKNELVEEAREKAIARYEEIKDDPVANKRKRILLTGGPNTGVKNKLVTILEDANIDIVAIDACNGIKERQDLIDETLPPLEALARKYMNVGCSVMTWNDRRIKDMGDMIEDYKIDGVVECVLQACHTFQIEARRVRKFVQEEKNLPYIAISTDYSTADYGQISTRLNAFVEML
ncbi:MAG: 2-hydroxyacyl-CoA dehydratase [Tissierellia bacterium]|nr:2-hydroxyacyl-CoA dehydratase [Tissierellia bacterium]